MVAAFNDVDVEDPDIESIQGSFILDVCIQFLRVDFEEEKRLSFSFSFFFFCICKLALAEAGVIPSQLLGKHYGSDGSKGQGGIYFFPERYGI